MASLRLLLALVFATVLMALPSTAGAVVDGEVDTSHDYVVFVGQTVVFAHPSFNLPGLPPGIRPVNTTSCSGTLVAPSIVVTAAHCSLYTRPDFIPADAQVVAITYTVRQGDDVIVAPGTPPPYMQRMATIHLQPGFEFGGNGLSGFSNNDLAVLRLNAPLPGPYAELPGLDASSALSPKDDLDILGYGVSDMHGNDPIVASRDGQRRRDRARLLGSAAVADDLLHFNAGACVGDSGGPLLNGNVLLGVLSFAPSACKSTSYATRVDSADSLAFIRSFL